jgi:hypothetical protein
VREWENGNAEYLLLSGSVSNSQPNSASQTNLASDVEDDQERDLAPGRKKNQLTITLQFSVKGSVQLVIAEKGA